MNTPPHLRLPPATWGAIRDDYVAGASAAVIADRYGLSERTVRRRAQRERWRRTDLAADHLAALASMAGRVHPAGTRARPDRILDNNPFIEDGMVVQTELVGNLLVHPTAQDLQTWAFQRAAECAVASQPNVANAWIRLAAAVERREDRLNRLVDGYSTMDRLRGELLRAMAEGFHDDDEQPDEIAESDEQNLAGSLSAEHG